MNEQELRAIVEEMVRSMAGQETAVKREAGNHAPAQSGGEGCLADIAELDLRSFCLIEHPKNADGFQVLRQKTPARLMVGRAGARYKTLTQLRMRADHAAAQDSVFSMVSEDFVKGQGYVPVQTLCENKDQYLTRPDLGRRFGPEAQEVIKKTLGDRLKVALVVGDGLSSAAVEANAADCLAAIRQGLKSYHIDCGPALFVTFCRVGASDHIGELTGAEVVCMLVGERPGLVTAESMSCYLTYGAHIGIPESRRTVVSNIHRQGTLAVEAGAHIADLIHRMLEQRASGIDLKEGGRAG